MDIAAIKHAAAVIERHIVRTPLVRAHALEELLHLAGPLYFKCENFQVTRSFKDRGAIYALSKLSVAAPAHGVVTRSSGNFAQALARAGALLGVAVTVVMPETAPSVKVERTRHWGANVVLRGTTHAEGLAAVRDIMQEQSLTFIPPFDHMDVLIGQGTAGLEICEELPNMRHFFCPIGGGGLLSGCALAIKALQPPAEVIAVEPAGAADFAASWAAHERVAIPHTASVADGLLAPEVGVNNWPILATRVDRVQVVSDEQIIAALRHIFVSLGMVVEPSGATALAGLIAAPPRDNGASVCLLSGANVDLPRFMQLLGPYATAAT